MLLHMVAKFLPTVLNLECCRGVSLLIFTPNVPGCSCSWKLPINVITKVSKEKPVESRMQIAKLNKNEGFGTVQEIKAP